MGVEAGLCMLGLRACVDDFVCAVQVEAGLGTKADRVWLARRRKTAV